MNDAPGCSEAERPMSSVDLRALTPSFVEAAQAEYDKWTVIDGDEDGFVAEYAGGGICHLMADALCGVMAATGVDCATLCSSHEQHVHCVARCSDGVFEVDIPWSVYETGAGYSWKRIEDVKFEAHHVRIDRLDPEPHAFERYAEG